jgi:hypothetical protein
MRDESEMQHKKRGCRDDVVTTLLPRKISH